MELSSPDAPPIEFWLEVTVHDFELPAIPRLKTDFGYSSEAAFQWCREAGYQGTRTALDELYAENAQQHGVSLREAGQFPIESADYARDLAAYRGTVQASAVSQSATFAVPSSLEDYAEPLALANAFVKENGLQDRAFCPYADSPSHNEWARVAEGLRAWHEAAPDIPALVKASGAEPFLLDAAGIWNVHLPLLDTANRRPILERIAEGGEVWWYVDQNPARPYGNFFVDFEAVEHRILFWQTWSLGIRGLHYWNLNFTPSDRNPWQTLLDSTPVNGNGFLVYPGAEGPVNSIRWETIRDGIEDYEYLTLLRERLTATKKVGTDKAIVERAEQALNLSVLGSNLVDFPRDPGRVAQSTRCYRGSHNRIGPGAQDAWPIVGAFLRLFRGCQRRHPCRHLGNPQRRSAAYPGLCS